MKKRTVLVRVYRVVNLLFYIRLPTYAFAIFGGNILIFCRRALLNVYFNKMIVQISYENMGKRTTCLPAPLY